MKLSFIRRLAASRLLWSAAALLLLYTLGGFLLAPWLIERYLPAWAEDHLGERATIAQVRINPFLLTLEASAFRMGVSDQPTLAFERLFVDFELASVVSDAWTFSDIRVTSPSVGLAIDRQGRFNIAEILARLRKPDVPASDPPPLLFERLVIDGARVSLTDLSGARRAGAVVVPVAIELHGISTLTDKRGRYTLSAKSDDGSTLTGKGELTLQPFSMQGELALRGFKLAAAWQFFRDALDSAEPEGELSVSGRYALGGKAPGALALSDVEAEISGLALAPPDGGPPLVALRSIRLGGGALTLPQRVATIGVLQFSDGAIGASVAKDGALDWQRLVKSKDAQSESAAPPAAPAAQPWQVHLAKAAIDRVAFTYVDRSRAHELELRAGAIDAELELRITAGAGPARVLAQGIRATLNGAEVASSAPDARSATLATLSLHGGSIDTAARTASAQAIELSGASIELARGADGPAGLLKALMQPGAAPAETAPAGEPWRVELSSVGFDKFALAYSDASVTPALTASARELKGRFQLEASAGAGPASVIAQAIELTIDGAQVTTPSAEAPLATIGSLALAGGRVDTGSRAAAAATIRLSGGGMEIARDRDGWSGLLRTFMPAKRTKPEATVQDGATASAWTYRVESFAVEGFDAALADRSFEPAIRYSVRVASAALENIDSANTAPIAFKAALQVAGKGTLDGSGALAQDGSGARAEVRARAIPLEPLQPLIARHAALELKTGRLSAAATVSYDAQKSPALTAQGRGSIAGFRLDEAGSGERFLSWKSMIADGIRLTAAPGDLTIADLRVIEPGMKLLIAEDRSVNVTAVLRPQRESPRQAAPDAPAKDATTAVTEPAQASESYPFRIESIRLSNGTLDFADLSLILPFSTRVHELGGSIVNASSAPDVRARIELAGTVAEYGEAHAEGSLILRKPTEFLDIEARFENVQMPPFSAYSATFAGRKIAAGKLDLTLQYKIVDNQLAGENKIVLENFVLGERVEAPNALDLPLDLAVALLKDSSGRIRLAVPVRGDVDHPEFDYGKVIRAAIGNAIARVVTAPFRMLASLFGKDDAEELRSIEFDAGSERIAPPQREKLEQIAQALKARPQLKLVVRGPYDPEIDAVQLRREAVRRQLAAALGTKLRPGERLGPIAYASANTQKALEALLETAEPNGVAALAKRFAERTGRRADRVNPVLGAFGRASKDAEFYEAVFERLVELHALPETAVRVLAANRATAMLDALTTAGVSRDRLQAGGITPVDAEADGSIEAAFALQTM